MSMYSHSTMYQCFLGPFEDELRELLPDTLSMVLQDPSSWEPGTP